MGTKGIWNTVGAYDNKVVVEYMAKIQKLKETIKPGQKIKVKLDGEPKRIEVIALYKEFISVRIKGKPYTESYRYHDILEGIRDAKV